MAKGWVQEAGPVVSFAQAMGNGYKTEVRLGLDINTTAALTQGIGNSTAPQQVCSPGTGVPSRFPLGEASFA